MYLADCVEIISLNTSLHLYGYGLKNILQMDCKINHILSQFFSVGHRVT